MALRFDNLDQLGGCSPQIRQQLERELMSANGPRLHAELDLVPAAPKKRARPEQEAGEALLQWVQLLAPVKGVRPIEVFYHVPNGGFRNPIEARIFYGQGVKAGWPDYGLDLPLGAYHGLRLELKSLNGAKPGADQLVILSNLERLGYRVHVAWGFEEARHAIEQYLALGT